MDNKEFKKLFGEIAVSHGFVAAYGGWYKQSDESIIVLELQKSSFSQANYLNLKVFIQGAFGKAYHPSKELMKAPMGHIVSQIRDRDFLDLERPINDHSRWVELDNLFNNFIVQFAGQALSRKGIKEMADSGGVALLPAVKEELEGLL